MHSRGLTSGSREVGGVHDEGGSAVVGSHSNILEDEGTVVEEQAVGVGGEGGAESLADRGVGSGREGCACTI